MSDNEQMNRPENIKVFTDLMAIMDSSNDRFANIERDIINSGAEGDDIDNKYIATVYNRFTSSMTQTFPFMKSIDVIYNVNGASSSLVINGKTINTEDDFWQVVKDWQS